LAEANQFIQLRMGHFALGEEHEIVLLLGRHVADHPADAVHWHQTLASIVVGDAIQTSSKFAARKTELGYKWVWHIYSFLSFVGLLHESNSCPF
jgi:hypothetical protein